MNSNLIIFHFLSSLETKEPFLLGALFTFTLFISHISYFIVRLLFDCSQDVQRECEANTTETDFHVFLGSFFVCFYKHICEFIRIPVGSQWLAASLEKAEGRTHLNRWRLFSPAIKAFLNGERQLGQGRSFCLAGTSREKLQDCVGGMRLGPFFPHSYPKPTVWTESLTYFKWAPSKY